MLVARRPEQVLTTGGRSLPVTRERNVVRRLVRVTTLGAVDPGWVRRWPTDRPCRRGTVPVRDCLTCKSQGGTNTTRHRGLQRSRTEAIAASGGWLGEAARPTGRGTWFEGHARHEQRHDCHCQPGYPQFGKSHAECGLAIL